MELKHDAQNSSCLTVDVACTVNNPGLKLVTVDVDNRDPWTFSQQVGIIIPYGDHLVMILETAVLICVTQLVVMFSPVF